MLPRNLLIWAVIVIGLVIAAGLTLQGIFGTDRSTQRIADEEANRAQELQQGSTNTAMLTEKIRQQEQAAAEEAAQKKIEEADARAEAMRTEMEKRKQIATTEGDESAKSKDNKPSKEDLEREKLDKLQETALASGIIAIGGKRSSIMDAANGVPAEDGSETMKSMNAMNAMLGAAMQGANAMPPDADQKNEDWLKTYDKQMAKSTVRFGPSETDGRVLHQGSTIPGVLITKIVSDLPGQITAQITHDVYDTINGNTIILPRGSKLIGRYNSGIHMGQERVMAAFERIIRPDGSSAWIGAMQGADQIGASGFNDEVDTHFWEMLGSSMLIAMMAGIADSFSDASVTIIGGTQGSGETGAAIGGSAGQVLVKTAEKSLDRYTDRKPTIIINPGYRFNIVVNKDIRL